MQTVSCPSCGATVQFRSHAAVMAVCEYCQTSVLKDADSVKDLGKMSSVLEDFSPVQIGTAGSFGGRAFTVVGRIQLKYSAGMWNEWFLLFDDGSNSWLGDSSGLYTLTTERKVVGALPDFAELHPGNMYSIGVSSYTASEVRVADCIGGQGELPFRVGEGWQARVADFRSGPSFLTLDYSDSAVPTVFTGIATTLEDLKCQLLREDHQIAMTAGKYKGKLSALDCPACGSAVKYLPGITSHLICQSCNTALDAASPKAEIVAAGQHIAAHPTTLALGAQAKINNQVHTVIGAMRRMDEEGTEWTEYLVYNTRNAFFWLVETDEGWSRAMVLPNWPIWTSTASENAVLEKVSYSKLYDYVATVTYAVGAFNWRVMVGDQVRVFEFESGSNKLAAELTTEEMTWSRAVPMAVDQMKAWFGDELSERRYKPLEKRGTKVNTFLWWLLALNIIPVLLEPGATWFWPTIAALAIYLPGRFLEQNE